MSFHAVGQLTSFVSLINGEFEREQKNVSQLMTVLTQKYVIPVHIQSILNVRFFLYYNFANFNSGFPRSPFFPARIMGHVWVRHLQWWTVKCLFHPLYLWSEWSPLSDTLCRKVKGGAFSMNCLLSWITLHWIHIYFFKVPMKEYSSKVWLGVGGNLASCVLWCNGSVNSVSVCVGRALLEQEGDCTNWHHVLYVLW